MHCVPKGRPLLTRFGARTVLYDYSTLLQKYSRPNRMK